MKIEKFKKKGKDKYEVFFEDGTSIELYEDVIINNQLLVNKYVDETVIKDIKSQNNNSEIYIKCVKYISIRMRSKNEIREYLIKNNCDKKIIDEIINKLCNNGLLNEQQFVKSFINDKLLMTNHGPYKIKKELLKHKIDEALIDNNILNIDEKILLEKIEKIINKYVKTNHKYSGYILKNKIQEQLNILGYPKYLYQDKIDNISINNEDEILKKEALKEYKKLSKKYSELEIKSKLKQKLYQKGFGNINIDDILNNIMDSTS
ncbi:MAG: hypothetical protein E7166_01435 [Firmicutes bacterium]|nr:hypothetical protein [Bacillota bacterium]